MKLFLRMETHRHIFTSLPLSSPCCRRLTCSFKETTWKDKIMRISKRTRILPRFILKSQKKRDTHLLGGRLQLFLQGRHALQGHPEPLPDLLVQSFVVLKQGLEGLEDLHLAGDPGRRLGLPLHHGHPQAALVAGHQALQVLQQQLEEAHDWRASEEADWIVRACGDPADTDPSVVSLCLQLCNLLLPLQQLLPAQVQLFGQHRKLLKGHRRSKTADYIQLSGRNGHCVHCHWPDQRDLGLLHQIIFHSNASKTVNSANFPTFSNKSVLNSSKFYERALWNPQEHNVHVVEFSCKTLAGVQKIFMALIFKFLPLGFQWNFLVQKKKTQLKCWHR